MFDDAVRWRAQARRSSAIPRPWAEAFAAERGPSPVCRHSKPRKHGSGAQDRGLLRPLVVFLAVLRELVRFVFFAADVLVGDVAAERFVDFAFVDLEVFAVLFLDDFLAFFATRILSTRFG